MSHAKKFVLLAGAAISLVGVNSALAQSNDETRAVVAEMLSDSQNRTSLLADAGHDAKGFMISGEGFTLRVGGQIQFRYVANFRDEDSTSNEFEPGFQTRRTKLWFGGNIVNEKWKYFVQGAFDRDEGGSFGLEQAWVSYDFGSGFYSKWGQYKLAFLREENISSSKQLAAERSIANEFFNQDYSQGIALGYKADAWRFEASFSDGLGSRNTDFTSSAEADWALTGRAEFKIDGDWDQFDDFTAPRGGKFGALIGAAVHYQDSANTSAPTDVDMQYLGYTVDVSLEGDGWNAYGAFMGRNLDTRGPVGAGDADATDDFGFVIQGGLRVAENTEIFARWDAVFLDEDTVVSGEDNFHFLTVGLNQYYAGHAAKATLDFVYSFSETSPNFGGGFGGLGTGTGVLGDTEEGEVVVRAQFQLLF
ncbi:MAG: porin [Phycisphaerales bacterium]